MKQIDVSSKVMGRVVGFEKRRSLNWLARITAVVIVLFILAALFLIPAIMEINDLRSWDLLTPFTKDWEQASQIWQDLLTAFWNEIPKTAIFVGIFCLAAALFFIVIKRKRIKSVANRLKSAWDYRNHKS